MLPSVASVMVSLERTSDHQKHDKSTGPEVIRTGVDHGFVACPKRDDSAHAYQSEARPGLGSFIELVAKCSPYPAKLRLACGP
jgi:hypothetical protein